MVSGLFECLRVCLSKSIVVIGAMKAEEALKRRINEDAPGRDSVTGGRGAEEEEEEDEEEKEEEEEEEDEEEEERLRASGTTSESYGSNYCKTRQQ